MLSPIYPRRDHMRASILVILAVLLLTDPIQADIPQILSYQGKVTDSGGVPVADGLYTMRFKIYDDPISGTLEWDSSPRLVQVTAGIFSVLLGESPQPSITLPFDEPYWLQVTVAGDELTPRQRLGSVGYSFMASGLVPGTEVNGSVSSGSSAAIKGVNSASTGSTFGGRFECASTSGSGVYGMASASTGATYGVYGISNSTVGIGVLGYAPSSSGSSYGVYSVCASTQGTGVLAHASSYTGNTYGLWGQSDSESGTGVYGSAHSFSGANYGVYGETNSSSGYGVYFEGGIAGTGTKSCVVKTSQGPTLLYCQESPENWFEDFGEGRFVDGRAHIDLDPLFLETVTIDDTNPMKVFIQLRDDCKGTFVKTGTTGFDVRELQDGTSDAAFAYRVVAKRKGFEEKRLDYCKAAETDSYLYPELREKKMREHEEERARLEQERPRTEKSKPE